MILINFYFDVTQVPGLIAVTMMMVWTASYRSAFMYNQPDFSESRFSFCYIKFGKDFCSNPKIFDFLEIF